MATDSIKSISHKLNTLATNAESFTTLSGLVNYIKTFRTNEIICAVAGPSTGLTSESSLYAMVFVLKASSNNAYYCAVSRDKMSIGNISLANTTVSVKHDIL